MSKDAGNNKSSIGYIPYNHMWIVLLSFGVFLANSVQADARPRYAAMVIDGNTGKTLFSRNPDAIRHPASLTKVMTLYMLFNELKRGRKSYHSELIVTTNAAQQAPSKLGLKAGDRILVIDAIRALITKSANDVAVTVAENLAGTEQAFAREMTVKARSLGMTRTIFRNASGLPNPKQITTARDMIILSQKIMHHFPKLYSLFKTRYFSYRGRNYKNHNSLLFKYKGTEGIKTGYTRTSGFNLTTSVRRKNKHLIAVVMGGKSARKRDAHMRAILDRTFPKASSRKKYPKPKSVPVAQLQPHQRNKVSHKHLSVNAPQALARANVAVVKGEGSRAPAKNTQLQPAQPLEAKKTQSFLQQSTELQTNPTKHKLAEPTPPQKVYPVQPTKPQLAQPKKAAGPFHVQIGAFSTVQEAERKLTAVNNKARDLLRGHPPVTMPVPDPQKQLIRARFAAFSKNKARSTCSWLRKRSIDCIVMRAQ